MQNTVIIPAWHAAWCLGECLDSIARQTLRPNRIMIGVDACLETAEKALELKAELAKRSRQRHTILVDVLYFPEHCYPYRIRNTLAILAADGILHFFDADDTMNKDHIDVAAANVKPGMFINARAMKTEENGNGKQELWRRAHGVVSIMRDSFIMAGGFEPWRCGADTEAQKRWEFCGLKRYETKDPTMIVRKHSGGLTSMPETGYQSDVRKQYKAEIARRLREPARLDRLAIGEYVRIESMDDLAGAVASMPPMPPDAILEPPKPKEHEVNPVEVENRALMGALRALVAVTDRGFDRRRRAAWDLARRMCGL